MVRIRTVAIRGTALSRDLRYAEESCRCIRQQFVAQRAAERGANFFTRLL